MSHVIDIAKSLVGKLGNIDPVLFQRDDILYVANENAFAQLSHGIPFFHYAGLGLSPSENQELFDASENAFEVDEKERSGQRRQHLSHGEAAYFRPLVFGVGKCNYQRNGSYVTLSAITNAAQQIDKLPRDGKIRLVHNVWGDQPNHDSEAGHGQLPMIIDAARVINLEHYLDMVRKQEDAMMQAMEEFPDKIARGKARDSDLYGDIDLDVPDCFVLTENTMLTFPRVAYLTHHDNRRTGKETWLPEMSPDNILPVYNKIPGFEKAPYAMMLAVNGLRGEGDWMYTLATDTIKRLDRAKEEIAIIQSDGIDRDIKGIVDRLNGIHGLILSQREVVRNREIARTT